VSGNKRLSLHLQRNLIAGILTIIPILVVWLVLEFVFDFLFWVGSPVGHALITIIGPQAPGATPWLSNDLIEWCVAVVVALLLIYAIGATASRVVGLRLIALFESLIARIPFVQQIYSASKKLIVSFRPKTDGGSRVVLIDFPSPEMKTVAFLMRNYTDTGTGQEMTVVYVPTAFNPTAGFVELVPARKVTTTDLTMDQAWQMVLSGGAVAPDRMRTVPPQ
jgi:uncharacterized membrane protein